MSTLASQELASAGTEELLAIIEILFLVAQADGVFSPEERQTFLEHVHALSQDKLETPELSNLMDRWGTLEALDVSERLEQLAALLPSETSRQRAYALAWGLAATDGQIMESESVLLFQLAEALGLSEDECEEIVRSVGQEA